MIYRENCVTRQLTSVGSAMLNNAKVKLQKIVTRRAKLSCRFDALTIAVSRYFINTTYAAPVTQIPSAVTQAKKTPAASFNCRFFAGKGKQSVLATFGFCFSGHSVQLVDPGSLHLTHFQQQGAVTYFLTSSRGTLMAANCHWHIRVKSTVSPLNRRVVQPQPLVRLAIPRLHQKFVF